ncbi:hypothetical protein [Roseobacter litoralis]|uniref:hypothetical protein n=1 Tax=Roseobacter litoralis TaxID=42443 RepID=UPI002492E29F|nr:hypothetical protein [Roseobacter litoralis]
MSASKASSRARTSQSHEAKVRDHWRGDIRQDTIWDYYRSTWWTLHEFINDVGVLDVEFDRNLSTLFQKRRLPWGVRIAEADDKNGFAEGDLIPQVVLDEQILKRSAKGAKDYLLVADEANKLPGRVPTKGRSGSGAITIDHDVLLDRLTKYLCAHWGVEYPKPAGIFDVFGQYEVRFFNDPADQNPASYIREDYASVVYLGKAAPTDPGVQYLPGKVSLADLLLALLEESEFIPSTDSTRQNGIGLGLGPTFFRNGFGRSAQDRTVTGIRSGLYGATSMLTRASSSAIIVSVEGAGKSTALLEQADLYRADDGVEDFFPRQGLVAPAEGFQIFASQSYDQAEEQCARFNLKRSSDNRPACGVLLKSFEQQYREYCDQADIPTNQRLSWEASLKAGYASQVDAVFHKQPQIYDAVTKTKNEAWMAETKLAQPETIGFNHRGSVIMFTSHKMAQDFNQPSKNKAWLHPDFHPEMTTEEWLALALEFRAYRIIHDELSLPDLFDHATKQQFDLCTAFRKSVERDTQKSWRDLSNPDQLRHFINQASDDLCEIGFYHVKRIVEAGFQPEDRVVLDYDVLPFGEENTEDSLYRGQSGNVIYIRPRDWWYRTKARICVATTEQLVAEIAGQLRNDAGDRVFRVERWDEDRFFPIDNHLLILDRQARKKDIQNLVDTVLADSENPTQLVISDMATGEHVHTHASARGRNDLDDKHITTVLTFIGPAEYAVLNAVAVRYFPQADVNLVHLYYRDRWNQAAGRNRGLRARSPEACYHAVVVSPKLYRCLGGSSFFGEGRYRACLVA